VTAFKHFDWLAELYGATKARARVVFDCLFVEDAFGFPTPLLADVATA
jgi:hypothetical protein